MVIRINHVFFLLVDLQFVQKKSENIKRIHKSLLFLKWIIQQMSLFGLILEQRIFLINTFSQSIEFLWVHIF